MSSRPYFKFYPSLFMGDTRRLTAEQRGAYIAILCELWIAGGNLPLDHEELAILTGVPDERWPAVWEKLTRFFEYEGAYFSNKRITGLVDEMERITEERKAASARGVAAKRLKKQRGF